MKLELLFSIKMLFTSMQFNDYLQKENLGQVTLS